MKFIILLLFSTLLLSSKPELLLLKNYTPDANITGWYMSEKLDGVRAYWDGKHLISRSGKRFAAPQFFTKEFPNFKLDGELWSRRGDFSNIVSIVNTKEAKERWKELAYYVFEVPEADGNLTERLSMVKTSNYLQSIEQFYITGRQTMERFLDRVEKLGGEGVVVRDASLPYYSGRKKSALKVKSYSDAECEVVGYNAGEGKNRGKIGSLSCRLANAQIIKIGSGLSEAQRVNPPKLGTTITFKYYGMTSKGNPRFPIFLRERGAL